MSDLCRRLFYCCVPNRIKNDYENVLADSEREAVADLLNYLENVMPSSSSHCRNRFATACLAPAQPRRCYTASRRPVC